MASCIPTSVISSNFLFRGALRKEQNPKTTPSSMNSLILSIFESVRYATKAVSTFIYYSATSKCFFKFFIDVKFGFFITGKSTTVVTPPEAAPAVPYSNPSHFSFAMAYKLTWESISPGISISLL